MGSDRDSAVELNEVEKFQAKVVRDTSGLTITLMSAIGDKLDLFKHLAEAGSIGSDAFAQEAEIHPRYAKEWLSIMTSGGYVQYDPPTQ